MSDSDNQHSNPLDDIVLAKEFLEGSRVAELQTILQDPGADPEKLLSVIPAGQIVMLAMHAGEQWESLLSDLPKSVQQDSRALHELAHELVPAIGEHPAVQQIFSQALSDVDEEDPSEIDWHRITSITPTFWWIGELGSLVPWIRVGFRNARRELLLETTANFGDTAYLASTLTLLLKTNMERALDAKKRGVLSMETVEAAAEQINEMLQYASEISDFLKELIPSEKKPDVFLESLPPTTGS